MRALIPLVAIAALACSEAPAPEPAPAPAAAQAPGAQAPGGKAAGAKAPAGKAPAAAGAGPNAVEAALAPSPLDLDKRVRAAGLNTALSSLVPDRSFDMSGGSPDSVAVRTGVVLSDAILAGDAGSSALFVRRLEQARDGMKRLGMTEGQGVLKQVDGFIKAARDETASRGDFVRALDQILQDKVPEESWAPGDQTGPLLQAGAWLAGTNLIARAVVADGNAAAAQQLLRQPEVVDFFIGYVSSEGAEKAPDAIVSDLTATLEQLKAVASKPTVTVADAQIVVDATDQLLGQL